MKKRSWWWMIIDAVVILLGIWSPEWWWKAMASGMAVLVVAIAYLDALLIREYEQ